MMRVLMAAFVCSTLFTACASGSRVSGHSDSYSYRREQMQQKRLDRENFKQRKKMVRASNKQNHGGWDTNSMGNVYGL